MSTTKFIEINPVTRVEGHGKITVALGASGAPEETHFHVHSFRGFERFLRGAPAERLPSLTARVCGICYSAHRLASVRALENVWGVEPSQATHKLRELLLMGQFVESHALSLAVLTLPDLLYPLEGPDHRNVKYLLAKHGDVVAAALKLRQAGALITAIVGRRTVHPISAVVGGMTAPLAEEERQKLDAALDEGRPGLDALRDVFLKLLETLDAEILALGNVESNYSSLVDGDRLNFYRGRVRLVDAARKTLAEFEPTEYFDHITEDEEGFTNMKFPRTKDGLIFRVGPLARFNVAGEIPTADAAALAAEVETRMGPRPWNGTMPYHYARLIEAHYAWERAKELLADSEITSTDVKPKGVKIKAGAGTGVLEAPRGTLAHRYEISAEGFCEKADLIVATQHNNAGINASLHETASRLIKGPDAAETDLNKLEMVVRAYDPCLSCATHDLSGRAFVIEIADSAGNVLRRYS